MKAIALKFLLLISMMPITCNAGEKNLHNIEGLNEDIYYKLCGVWDRRKEIYEEDIDSALFTWGRSKFGPDSIIIDFGDKRTSDIWYDPPAILGVGESPKKILSIEIINAEEIVFNLEGMFWDDEAKWEVMKKGYYSIHINDDGTIWIDYHSTKKIAKRILYKISGPKRPKNK